MSQLIAINKYSWCSALTMSDISTILFQFSRVVLIRLRPGASIFFEPPGKSRLVSFAGEPAIWSTSISPRPYEGKLDHHQGEYRIALGTLAEPAHAVPAPRYLFGEALPLHRCERARSADSAQSMSPPDVLLIRPRFGTVDVEQDYVRIYVEMSAIARLMLIAVLLLSNPSSSD